MSQGCANCMFSSEHMIWKWAYWWDELDDWLPYAEELVNKWANQVGEEVEFKSEFDIRVAAFLLMDDLLPLPARRAFGELMLDTMAEAKKKKLTLTTVGIRPPRPGRQKDRTAIFIRNMAVIELIEQGCSKQDAYELAAKQFHKSPDTLRRDYERYLKRRKRRKSGEII